MFKNDYLMSGGALGNHFDVSNLIWCEALCSDRAKVKKTGFNDNVGKGVVLMDFGRGRGEITKNRPRRIFLC